MVGSCRGVCWEGLLEKEVGLGGIARREVCGGVKGGGRVLVFIGEVFFSFRGIDCECFAVIVYLVIVRMIFCFFF